MKINFICLALLLLAGCAKHDASLNELSPLVPTVKNDFDTPDMQKIFGPHELAFKCDGYQTVSVRSAAEVVVPSGDTGRHTVTLKSPFKDFAQSGYNLSSNCFPGSSCPVKEQLIFHRSGLPKNLGIYGHFTVLDPASAKKFDQIALNTLDVLKLTTDQVTITKDSLFGSPSTVRPLTLGESTKSDYDPGYVMLALIDDPREGSNYELYKIRVDAVAPGESVQLTYERIAEAPLDAYKNFFCSKRAHVLQHASDREGDATVFARWYSGYPSSTFGFDFGVNGFDGRYLGSRRVLSMGDPGECPHAPNKLCVNPGVASVPGYWGSVVDLGQYPISKVERNSWPPLSTLDPSTSSHLLEENKTYLVSQFTDQEFTFGALRITEIDPRGRWVKLHWRRVAVTAPERLNYIPVALDPDDVQGRMTLGGHGLKSFDLVNRSTSAPPLIFSPSTNEFQIDNRYYSNVSGIVDVSDNFRQLEDLPAGNKAKDLVEAFSGQFKTRVTVRAGAIYLVAAENFNSRTVLAMQVLANDRGRSAEVAFRRLYMGLARP